MGDHHLKRNAVTSYSTIGLIGLTCEDSYDDTYDCDAVA
jgi:hypothetical protein